MDLSKLPKLSNTGAEQSPPSTTPSQNPQPASQNWGAPLPPSGIGADVWFNLIIAIILLFMGAQFGTYLFDTLTGREFHTHVNWETGDKAGQEVAYSELQGHVMLTDGGLFVFGLVVLVEAVLKGAVGMRLPVPKLAIGIVLAMAVGGMAFNVYGTIRLFMDGVTPILSGIAAAFGGFIVSDTWQIYKASR